MSVRYEEINAFWFLQTSGDFLGPFVLVIRGKVSCFPQLRYFLRKEGPFSRARVRVAAVRDQAPTWEGRDLQSSLLWGSAQRLSRAHERLRHLTWVTCYYVDLSPVIQPASADQKKKSKSVI